MGISELRSIGGATGSDGAPTSLTAQDMVRRGLVQPDVMRMAEQVRRQCAAPLERILRVEGIVSEDDLLRHHARRLKARRLDAGALKALPLVETGLDPRVLIRHGVLPAADATGRALAVAATAEDVTRLRAAHPGMLADARIAIAPRDAVQQEIAARYHAPLTQAASARVPISESCRSWGGLQSRRVMAVGAGIGVLGGATLAFPVTVFGLFVAWAALTLVVAALLKLSAFAAGITHGRAGQAAEAAQGDPDQPLPRVSVLVPLFRETEILHALVARLSGLTYPKCLLDVILVLEEVDETTRAALAGIDLPPWIRPVVVPDAQPRTKPRAMNYALDFCEGDIIGIFDAEDAPDPDQITRVARRFQQVPRDVVCLQGVLDYYNSRQNWLARCFTIEYATWFRRILPGMARLGFAIPLGGTTLYFRRDALERLGGWDAHNVTEDADLGFRLARHGYRTQMITTVTEEEANCHPWAWVKQRSRWLKGYMTTYLVHMRRPRLLLRQLGAWRFLGFQAHFVTALSQVLLAPFLWSFWLVMLGIWHPLDAVLPHLWLIGMGRLFLLVEVLNIGMHLTAVSGRKLGHLAFWTPTMHLYALLGCVAAYKALYELVMKPFFWDKTTHGLSVQAAGQVGSDGARNLAGIQLEPGNE